MVKYRVPVMNVITSSVSDSVEMFQMGMSYVMSQALYVTAKIALADHFGEEARSVEYLAKMASVDTDALGRLLLVLEEIGIVSTEKGGLYLLTSYGELLRSDSAGSMKNIMALLGEEQYLVFSDLLKSVITGNPAFEERYGSSFYKYMHEDLERSRNFGLAMSAMDRLHTASILEVFSFPSEGVIVDVGGGTGGLLIGILKVNLSSRGIVYDLSSVMEEARLRIEDACLASRCSAVSGDFFESVPKCDSVLLRRVLHNWNDTDSLSILANCNRALPVGGSVFIIERLIVEDEEQENVSARLSHLSMLVLQGGRERNISDYRRLLEESGFLLEVVNDTTSGLSILVGTKC